jgi:hypothetical protein
MLMDIDREAADNERVRQSRSFLARRMWPDCWLIREPAMTEWTRFTSFCKRWISTLSGLASSWLISPLTDYRFAAQRSQAPSVDHVVGGVMMNDSIRAD